MDDDVVFPLLALPDDVLHLICNALEGRDRSAIRGACRRLRTVHDASVRALSVWAGPPLSRPEHFPFLKELEIISRLMDFQAVLPRLPRTLRTLKLYLSRELWDPDDSSLGTLTQLSTLKLVGSKFAEPPYVATDDHLAGLSSLTGLSALTLRDHSSLTGAGLAHLRTCTALTSLVLSGCRLLRDEHLASLAAVTGLRSLAVQDSGNALGCESFVGAGLAFLSRLSHLTHLSLSGCTLVNDALLHASAAPALQVLDLRHSRGITDDGIAHLRHAPCLRVAHFNRMNAEMQGRILGHGIARLLACATVEEMDFSGVHGVVTFPRAEFAGCPNLRRLVLPPGDAANDDCLAHLAELPSLRCLDASRARAVSDRGVQYLAAAPSLETLVLPGGPSMSSGITDAALEALSRAQSLKHLSVLASRATDEGLAHLARCKHLESLELQSADGITVAGLSQLSSCRRLRSLKVFDCSRLSEQEQWQPLLKLVSSCPELQAIDVGRRQWSSYRGFFTWVQSQLASLPATQDPSVAPARAMSHSHVALADAPSARGPRDTCAPTAAGPAAHGGHWDVGGLVGAYTGSLGTSPASEPESTRMRAAVRRSEASPRRDVELLRRAVDIMVRSWKEVGWDDE